jgi:hypothetical protein
MQSRICEKETPWSNQSVGGAFPYMEINEMENSQSEETTWTLSEQEIEIVRQALYYYIGHLNGRFLHVEGNVQYAPYGLSQVRQLARDINCTRVPIWSRK